MNWKKLALGTAVLAVPTVGVVTLFGDNLRRAFGSSVNCLANSATDSTRATGSGHRDIVDFASQSSLDGSANFFPTPSGEAQPQLATQAWFTAAEERFSTFSADVDTASYSESRRALREGRLPNADTVRVEEFVNYFRYDYPAPTEQPFAVYTDLAPDPFHAGRQLLRVGVQAKRVAPEDRKTMHLTFLVDVSGSMNAPDRFPLVKDSLRILVANLNDRDTVSLVTYAGGVREVLPPTAVDQKGAILEAIDSLRIGGGTNMGSGMELAYREAVKWVRPGEVSRVIVLTDGDANIGNTTHADILKSVEGYVKEGVTLSTIGFGAGNYRDSMLEQLADQGNGNNYYVDDLRQARRVFEEQLTGMLQIVAKDLKLQVEFNPEAIRRYKLVGYENRVLAKQDFRNDKVDAGDVGAGHTVTALYEVELTGARVETLATVRVRAKAPEGESAEEQAFPVHREQLRQDFDLAPPSFRLATVAASFAEALRGNSDVSYLELETLAAGCAGAGEDAIELRRLIGQARMLSGPVANR
jgi:Ca-activated chloride channel family protein